MITLTVPSGLGHSRRLIQTAALLATRAAVSKLKVPVGTPKLTKTRQLR